MKFYDSIGPNPQGLLSFLFRFRFHDQPGRPGSGGPHRLHRRPNAPRPGQVVFLEHGRVIQPEAVVGAAATAHGVFLQHPQSRGGFPGVHQPHTRASQFGHQGRGGRGHPRQPHGQVEGCALPRHQGRRIPRQGEQALAGPHFRSIRYPSFHARLGIQQAKQRFHQIPPAEHPLLLADPLGPALAMDQGRAGEIPPAQIFSQPGFQLAQQLGLQGGAEKGHQHLRSPHSRMQGAWP